jgi:hypothetical protein
MVGASLSHREGKVRALQSGKGIVRTSSGEKKRMNIVLAHKSQITFLTGRPPTPFLATALVL